MGGKTNLPLALDSFVGRTRELALVGKLVGEARLVTITGAPGIGKTRLALEVAAGLSETFPDGAWFVDLAPVHADGSVPQAVASVIGVREVAGADLVETLVSYVEDRHMLVVLDNCEHLVASVAALADRMLRSCPRLSLLVTSREALGTSGERLFGLRWRPERRCLGRVGRRCRPATSTPPWLPPARSQEVDDARPPGQLAWRVSVSSTVT